MMKFYSLCAITGLLFASLLSGNVHAQLYKWVGPDGKITYSDIPPPPGAKQLPTKSFSGEGPSVVLPADLAAAVAKNPVTLYTTAACDPCNQGRSLLKQRGVPFSEKTITSNEDIEKLKQVSGGTHLPVMVISNSKFPGLDEAQWRVALNSAGYPEANKLPRDYRYPAAEPAVPPAAPPAKKEAVEKQAPAKAPVPSESGIRF